MEGEVERIAATAVDSAVFLDPSGRRWRQLRNLIVVLVGLALAGVCYAFPKVHAAPALTRHTPHPNVTAAQTGLHVPVVGHGPLVRVLKIQRTGNQLVGYDPFTKARTTALTPAEARQAGTSHYVIREFGYSATAKRTSNWTRRCRGRSTTTPSTSANWLLHRRAAPEEPKQALIPGELLDTGRHRRDQYVAQVASIGAP